MVTCLLVPGVPPLLAGSCASPRPCGLGFPQTSPRDDACALLLAFGSANTWHGDFHPVSSVPCLAHTPKLSGAVHRVRCSVWLAISPALLREFSDRSHSPPLHITLLSEKFWSRGFAAVPISSCSFHLSIPSPITKSRRRVERHESGLIKLAQALPQACLSSPPRIWCRDSQLSSQGCCSRGHADARQSGDGTPH